MADKRTPMAWQHRDMNYHQGGYHERYAGYGYDMHGDHRPGPPSTSDRLSHRTDKSWRTRESHVPPSSTYHGAMPGPYGGSSRPSYSRQNTPDSSSETSSSSSDEESVIPDPRGVRESVPPPQSTYGYSGYYPSYYPGQAPPGYPPPGTPGYPGTIKSARSVPSIAMGTWDGHPCPVHGPLSLPMEAPPAMAPPMPGPIPGPMMTPGAPASLPPVMVPPRRAASIYDMRLINTPATAIYGTLPGRPQGGFPGDRRSLVGLPPPHVPPGNIPPQLLPPMVRPRPLVLSEDGTEEPLPVRSPPDKNGSISALTAKMAEAELDGKKNKRLCSKGCPCVLWMIISLIGLGILLALLLVYIL